MTNVISLFKQEKSVQENSEENSEENLTEVFIDKSQQTESFDKVFKQNAENKRRQEEERKKANKSVIRSYRLKH